MGIHPGVLGGRRYQLRNLILRQIWPLLLLPLVFAYVNWVVIPVEEGNLTEVFGDEYRGYQARTRRWL